jgi:tripartite-type tricarboxylate transporter receptor subunit TctC
MMPKVVDCGLLLLSLLIALGAGPSAAQTYPSKPIRILTAGAGGSSDTVARLLAGEISGPLGQSVLVENMATTQTGPTVAKSPPDGHTLLVAGPTLWVGQLLGPVPYDVNKDFAPITALTRQPAILVVHPSVPARNVKELIALAKAKPGELNYTSGGTGSISHAAAELFNSAAGVKIQRVAYKQQSAEMADLLAGRVQLTFGNGPTMGPLGAAGKVRPLATTGSSRSVIYPDLPLISETLPGYVAEQLLGFLAPAATPEAIVRRLNQESVRAYNKPEVKERLLKSGLESLAGTPEQFAAAIKAEMATVGKLIKAGAIQPGGGY